MQFWRSAATVALMLLAMTVSSSVAQVPSVHNDEWSTYKSLFLGADGRIIDNANGNISHSEGQGYGLLLAYLAQQPGDFEQIWRFTRSELLVRGDGLAAWRWDPEALPHIQDMNNATDGDILIAYALALAGNAWARGDYLMAASRIAAGILGKTVISTAGRTLLLPGVDGFSAESRTDGPVINPSYFVFEAFPVLANVVPSRQWARLGKDGVALMKALQFGPAKLPAEWVSMDPLPRPAEGFEARFSYNAIRIPLYLVRAGATDKTLLRRLAKGMSDRDGAVSVIDLKTGQAVQPLDDRGYRIIAQVVACVTDGAKLPSDSQVFDPAYYYPATLQLLGLSFVRERHPDCL